MRTGVLIMAKAPLPGRVKTRLAVLLGDHGAADLQAALIAHTVAWAAQAADVVSLAYAPVGAAASFAEFVPDHVALFPQRGADLGARMQNACADAGDRHSGPLAVIGTDAPLLGPASLDAAFTEIAEGADACLIPALDGGYVLLGLATPDPAAFAIPSDAWGGSEVCALTLAALRRRGLRTSVLAPLPDLDTPADALALRRHPRCPPALAKVLT
ncbi:TIGR04282 family arsenosugar biosynthesis glycosyltransferase [Conexibacter sp. DBS9H8]|uniref:TIGR04282 family arsenosugar biosynthesis glycosyltransferase n=1 Tax=Conexibacter sp. DBS9H8 TaxID=2937801 RepID=UPI00200E07CE|nr:TIGR04282 family arsenosugar biosynthesis glycosyltransferase [Conexibacter sp. DBS9H8]